MTVSLSPLPFQFLISLGSVAAGAKLFFYGAGGTTKQNTYTTSSGNVANANPIILDSGGNLPNSGEVWFQNGQAYKVVLAPANDTDPPQSPYWTRDNLSGINDSTLSSVEWIGGPAPTFVNTTQFTVVGDQHLVLDVNRQVKLSVTAGTIYGYITASSYVSSVTTVTVSLYNGAVLDSGLSAVWYGLLDPAHPSCPPIFNSPLSGTTGTFTGTVSGAPATASGQFVQRAQSLSGAVLNNVGVSRALAAVYTNSTSRAMFVMVCIQLISGGGNSANLNGVSVETISNGAGVNADVQFAWLVPPGGTYGIASISGTTLVSWMEIS